MGADQSELAQKGVLGWVLGLLVKHMMVGGCQGQQGLVEDCSEEVGQSQQKC